MNKTILLQAFLGNKTLGELAQTVGEQLGCTAIITDTAFHIVATGAVPATATAGLRQALLHSELPLQVCALITSRLQNGAEPAAVFTVNGWQVTAAPLSCGTAALGYLLYLTKPGKAPAGQGAEFAKSLLAKQFYMERRLYSLTGNTAEDLLIDLLEGKFPTKADFTLKAAGTFLAHFSPHRFVLLQFVNPAVGVDSADRLQKRLAQSFAASHPFFYGGQIVLFLHQDHDLAPLQSLTVEFGLRAVLSAPLDELYSLKGQFQPTAAALQYLAGKNNNRPFLAYAEQYALLTLLKRLGTEPDFNPPITQLANDDAAHNARLCQTLFAYLICHRSLQKTCELLFTHRNTVLYRIKKIKDDFNLDPDRPETCLANLLALALVLVRQGQEDWFLLPLEKGEKDNS